jgi:hypothetical protein
MADVKLSVFHDIPWDEWVVRWNEGGRINEAKSYSALGREDAISTMQVMASEARAKGHKVTIAGKYGNPGGENMREEERAFLEEAEELRGKLKSKTFDEAIRHGENAIKAAASCKYPDGYEEALSEFLEAGGKLKLIAEGFEHLGKDAKEDVAELIGYLEQDLAKTLIAECDCKKFQSAFVKRSR